MRSPRLPTVQALANFNSHLPAQHHARADRRPPHPRLRPSRCHRESECHDEGVGARNAGLAPATYSSFSVQVHLIGPQSMEQ